MLASLLLLAALGAPVPPAPPPAEARAAESPPPSFDFDLVPAAKDATPDRKLERALRTRRTMLVLHQSVGIAMTALMAATVVVGQLNYSDRFSGAPATGNYELLHADLATATTVAFAAAGLLALLAPVPIPKKSEGIDSITVHKWSMLTATVAMATEIVLGILTVSREGFANQASLATTHLVIGYTTAGATAVGVGALFF
ncbi:MAG: hypothetical protein ACYCWW_14000 [Deltaproteobacteria bacterium]